MSSSRHVKKDNSRPEPEHASLPEGYGKTEAGLLPRDPNWMFIYWEISEATRTDVCRTHGPDIFQKARKVIRVYDISEARDKGPDKHKCFDIQVAAGAKTWYINVPESGKAYYCEIGLVLPDGAYICLVKSNTANLPAGRVSEISDEKWMDVSSDFDGLLRLSGVEHIGKGSGEIAESLAQRWEMLRAVFSRASSWGVGSMSSHVMPEAGKKKFWLVADCELILYGATEPDARLTVAGRQIMLNPDGTFSMRFALMDGLTELPIKAVSKDETETRGIEVKVTRNTDAE